MSTTNEPNEPSRSPDGSMPRTSSRWCDPTKSTNPALLSRSLPRGRTSLRSHRRRRPTTTAAAAMAMATIPLSGASESGCYEALRDRGPSQPSSPRPALTASFVRIRRGAESDMNLNLQSLPALGVPILVAYSKDVTRNLGSNDDAGLDDHDQDNSDIQGIRRSSINDSARCVTLIESIQNQVPKRCWPEGPPRRAQGFRALLGCRVSGFGVGGKCCCVASFQRCWRCRCRVFREVDLVRLVTFWCMGKKRDVAEKKLASKW
uniref:Uncharacterized protein n=1 Tax=Pseudictyota dubia TaxID=2749911 RepID=A0A7R9W8B4_9STRA|mmetsp:Transcript_38550/g.71244  ORF Transcript_38550/g.71244 Transcript_38550/m.71244 type:complete len:262 (+) Transcript_38550:126-911(+)